jgi:hypothetical protein
MRSGLGRDDCCARTRRLLRWMRSPKAKKPAGALTQDALPEKDWRERAAEHFGR